jgi:hypothetical protein
LFGLELAHLPAAGHGDQRPLSQLDRLERFGGVGLTAGSRVRVKNARKVGRRLRSREDRQRESPQLSKQQ